MLPQKNRLPKSAFDQSGKFIGKPTYLHCVTFVSNPNSLGRLRLGVLIPKKNYPNAVDRNHLKRQIHEIIQQNIDLSAPFDLLIVTKLAIKNLNYQQLSTELIKLLATLKT